MAEIKITKCKSCGASITWIKTKNGRVRRTSTTTYTKSTKYVSSADAYTSTKANAARRFRQWLS